MTHRRLARYIVGGHGSTLLGLRATSRVRPGSYLVDVAVPDGRASLARLVMLPGRKTRYLELDYARAVPPDDDEDY